MRATRRDAMFKAVNNTCRTALKIVAGEEGDQNEPL
jgi:hypothetical protein